MTTMKSLSTLRAARSDPTTPFNSDPLFHTQVWDLIVVGAGVAGAAFAYQQGQQGRRVLLLERDLAQPDRFVGELLQPGGVLALRRLGLGHAVEGIDAQAVYGYALFKEGRAAELCYPDPADFGTLVAAGAAERGEHRGAEADRTSTPGVAFHNGRFVQRLRAEAKSCANVTVRRGTVTSLVAADGAAWAEGREQPVAGVRYRAAGEERAAFARLTVVCDGMYSALRAKLAEADLRTPSSFVALKLHDVALPYPAHGHCVLADPAPVLFYPISSREVRCLVDYPGDGRLPSVANGDLARYLLKTVAPQVPSPELRAAFERAVSDGRVRSMANKQLTCAPAHIPGAILLGDSFNMRHPLTGGGMTVALSDAALLCDLLPADLTSADAAAVADATAEFYLRRKPWAATINTLANALYRVFCAAPGDAAHEAMRRACYDYLASGGERARGPMSLISGVNPRPATLARHFFSVALFAVAGLLFPRPTLRGLWTAVVLLYGACCILLPILAKEGYRAVFAPSLAPRPRVSPALRRAAANLTYASCARGA